MVSPLNVKTLKEFKRGIDPKKALGIGIKEQNKNSTRLYRNLEEFFKEEWDIPILAYTPYINFIYDSQRLYKMPSFDMSLSLPEAFKFRKNSYRKKKLRKWFNDNTIWYILKIKYEGEVVYHRRKIGEFRITLR